MKKIIALLLTLTMMLSLSVPAFAATTSGSSGVMTVTYQMSSSYVINLPELIITDSGKNEFYISAEYVHIASDKKLYVSVDATTTLDNGVFYLTGFANGKNNEMECKILISNADENSTASEHYISTTNTTLAVFAPETTKAQSYGKITLTPKITSTTPVAHYSGSIYYTIKVE